MPEPVQRYEDGRMVLPYADKKRFLDKVAIPSLDSPNFETACWDFAPERKYRNWYGLFWVNRRNFLAHRLSYELFKGEIPDGMMVMHSCDRPSCVRPSHLSVGSCADNVRDAVSKGRNVRGSLAFNAKLFEFQAIEIRERVAAGEDMIALAEEYGVRVGIISGIATGRSWRHVGGPIRTPRRGKTKFSDKDVKEIRRMRHNGMKLVDLAMRFGVKECTISAICTGRNWSDVQPEKLGPRIPIVRDGRGTRVWNAKVNDEKVAEIRKRYAAGETILSLADSFGLSGATTQKIIRGKLWAHVPGAYTREASNVKMNVFKVRCMRALWAQKVPKKKLAQMFKVSLPLVQAVCSRKKWDHIPEEAVQ